MENNHRLLRRIAALLCLSAVSLSGCLHFRNADGSETTPARPSSGVSRETAAYSDGGIPLPDRTVLPDETSAPLETTELTDPYLGVDISFIAAGDNLIHPNIYMDAKARGSADKEYDFLPVYSDVADRIAAADYAFINQETVMAGAAYGYSGYPCFNSPRQLGLDLVTLGFDIVNIANNHMLDMGTQGLSDTMDFWHTQPVLLLGAFYDEADAAVLRTLTTNEGITIGMLSYTYGTNGIVKKASSPIDIPYIDTERIDREVRAAREAVDFVIVSIHWGLENTHTPTDEQKYLAQRIADAGADVILGHHSHSIQPIEWIETDRGQTLCAYSLGNFISGMARPMNAVGGLLSFHIEGDGEGGLVPASVEWIPTVFYYGMNWYGTHLYYLEDYTAEIAATHGTQLSGYTLSPEDARQMTRNVIDAQFLPDYLRN